MKKVILSVLFCSFFLFTSCFQMIEEVFLNKNGSGTMQVTLDMGSMMGMFSAFMPDSLKEGLDFDKMMGDMDGQLADMRAIDGVTNVQVKKKGEYAFTLSYDFKDVVALKEAIKQNGLQKDGGLASTFLSGFRNTYDLKKRYVHRTFELKDMPSGEEMPSSNPFEEMGDMGDLIQSPTYQFIYHVPKKFKKVNVKDAFAKVEQSKDKIKLTYNLFDLMSQKGKVIDHELKFK